MGEFLGLSETGWIALYTFISGGLLFVAVLAAVYAKRQWRAAKEQLEESRIVSIEASRPYVIVTAEPGRTSRAIMDLCVRNIGERPAFNVHVSLNPAPKRAKETPGLEIASVRMLSEPIAMVAPRQELRTFYDSVRDRKDRADLPSVHQVQLKYSDSSGREYEETSTVDLDALRGSMYVEEKSVHHIAKSLEEIRRLLSSASVLGATGELSVEAAIEARDQRLSRLEHEHYLQSKRHVALVKMFIPNSESISGLEKAIRDYEAANPERISDDGD